jgi:hypothetical protein
VTATGDTTSSTPLATNSFDIVVFDGFFGRIGALGVFFTGAAAFLAVVPTDFSSSPVLVSPSGSPTPSLSTTAFSHALLL